MKILLLLPYAIDSHLRWAEGLQAQSKHEIHLLSLSGSHWKWRMHGAALSFAKKIEALSWRPDVILATDMMDVGVLGGLLRKNYADIPLLLYFHENQLTYPWSATDKDVSKGRDRHYAWINFTSALAADQVIFNSNFHKNSFLNALPDFLKAFPDHQELESVEVIRKKSHVCYPGIDLQAIIQARPDPFPQKDVPLILWNHRWEYDKNPEAFFRLLYQLSEEGIPFNLCVLGKHFSSSPSIFKEAKKKLAQHIVHWGFVENREAYLYWLWKADFLPVCSKHDFFGISVLEAIAAKTYPLLPLRQAYPEHISAEKYPELFYEDEIALYEKLKACLTSGYSFPTELSSSLSHYDVGHQVRIFDALTEKH